MNRSEGAGTAHDREPRQGHRRAHLAAIEVGGVEGCARRECGVEVERKADDGFSKVAAGRSVPGVDFVELAEALEDVSCGKDADAVDTGRSERTCVIGKDG